MKYSNHDIKARYYQVLVNTVSALYTGESQEYKL